MFTIHANTNANPLPALSLCVVLFCFVLFCGGVDQDSFQCCASVAYGRTAVALRYSQF